jgi:hypothetical protein
LHLCCAANNGKRRSLSGAGEALNALNAISRTQHILNYSLLRPVETRLLVDNRDSSGSRENRLDLVTATAYAADNFLLRRNGLSRGELTTRYMRTLHRLEFSRSNSGIKVAANLGVGDLAHTSPESISDQRPLIDNSFSLEVLIPRKRERFPHAVMCVVGLLLMLRSFPGAADHGIRLVSEVGGELAMGSHHLAGGMNFLPISSGVRGDLSRLFSVVTGPFQILANLLTPRARRIEVFLGVAFDLWRAASANRDLISEFPQSVRQFGLIDSSCELLRRE